MKETLQKFLILIISLIPLVSAYGQQVNVFVTNQSESGKDFIAIKWFSESFIYNEGVNVYRKSDGGEWQRLNDSPVSLYPYTVVEEQEQEVREFFNAVLKDPNPAVFQEELILFQFLLQGILDNDFAKHAGIYFEDKTVIPNVKYQYKIERITGSGTALIGISNEIVSGPYKPASPVTQLEAIQDKKSIIFNWLPDEDRFFGVNIYKTEEEGEELKLNENPLVISLVEDSLGNLSYPKPMFKEDRLKQGLKYTYRIVGMDYFGNEMESSQPIVVDFKDVTPPNPPLDFLGKADSMNVKLDWTYEELEFINGFKLYKSTFSDGPFTLVNEKLIPKELRHYEDLIETAGNYIYYLADVDLSGKEAKSFPIYVDVQAVLPPAIPEDFTIEADSGLISLKWQRNNEPDLAGYFVFRTSGKGLKGYYSPLNGEPFKENYYYDTLAGNVKSSFFYYVVAADTSYNRSNPTEKLSAKMPDLFGPQ